MAGAASEYSYRQGQLALVMFGDPTRYLFVVRTGAMELVQGAEVIEVLEPGTCFGHPSLASGLAPTFSVRAREDSTCLLIPGEIAMEVLAKPAGTRYLARSLRDRLVRAERTSGGLPDLSFRRVVEVAHSPPVTVAPEDSVRNVAGALTEARATAAYVALPDGPGIVTDADLRERVLSAGLAADEPVSVAVRSPALSIPAERTAGEALMDLLDSGQREALVTENGRVVGIVSVDDIAGGERSPFALRRAIERAENEDELVAIVNDGLPRLQASLLAAGLAPMDVSRALTVQSDTVTGRFVDFALDRHGPAPVAWAWMGLGSVARRELTLASDQDNAMAYAEGGPADVDSYFERVAGFINAGLARCGFGEDNAEVLARNKAWRMPAARWRAILAECLEQPDRSHLVRAAVTFDFRHAMGGLDIVTPFVAVLRRAREHPDFLARLARTATDWDVPVGRRGISTGKDGTFDIKKGGSLPITNVARFHALAAGITTSASLDRLTAAEEVGQLDAETASSMREAFGIVFRVRHEHHAECVRAGRAADNLVNPSDLSPPRRAELTEALREVAAAQRQLGAFRPMGL